jgi:hypothetical protein
LKSVLKKFIIYFLKRVNCKTFINFSQVYDREASARRPFKGVSSVWFESAPFTSALFETVQVVKLETEEKIAMVDEKADVVKAELLSEHARSVAEIKTFIETR